MSTRPRILDLFCGAGGAAMGYYYRAGFEVVGVDLAPQPNYPFEFHQGNALAILEDWATRRIDGGPFDAIHASPPCQAYSPAGTTRRRTDHPDLVGPVRELLRATGLPYVIENIPTAPMPSAILLCGSTFGLPIIRHRLFEIHPSIGLVPSSCPQKIWTRTVDHGAGFYPFAHRNWEAAWRRHVLPKVWPWMTLYESRQAIPPAYTEFIGERLLEAIKWNDSGVGMTPRIGNHCAD